MWGVLLFLCFVALLSVLVQLPPQQGHMLVVREQRTHNEFLRLNVNIGDHIELSWIHSVEKTPWLEILEVTQDKQLVLRETRFQSFGAGVPYSSEGDVYVENGYTVMTGLDQIFQRYQWIHSQEAKFRLKLNGKQIMEPEKIPHHLAVEMFVEKR